MRRGTPPSAVCNSSLYSCSNIYTILDCFDVQEIENDCALEVLDLNAEEAAAYGDNGDCFGIEEFLAVEQFSATKPNDVLNNEKFSVMNSTPSDILVNEKFSVMNSTPSDTRNKISVDNVVINSTDVAKSVQNYSKLNWADCVDSDEDNICQECLSVVVEKFDTACSKCMSGVHGRISEAHIPLNKIGIRGFNSSVSLAALQGKNDDGKIELYVPDMPSDIVLLCANDYAKEGAAILMSDSGVVIKFNSEHEKNIFESFILNFEKIKELVVKNRTYEVKHNANSIIDTNNVALSSTATRYFNTKVHVTNVEERIMAMLLTGLSFADLYNMVSTSNVTGIPRDLTIQALNNFEHRYGRTPDILQRAIPNLAGNTKGYMPEKVKITYCGQRVEADYFTCEFLDKDDIDGKTMKMLTHGGAAAAFIAVDAFSGFIMGSLVKSVSSSIDRVKETVNTFKTDGNPIDLFAADQGIVAQSLFRVCLPEVQAYLQASLINIECGEAYNHDNGTSICERTIRIIKELIRFAVLYILNNPNFKHFGFTKIIIFKLWGDLFYWAIAVINLKPCPNDDSKTRSEVYYRVVPDLRRIRLLPIFSCLYVLRRQGNDLGSNRSYWQRGLYVGPSSMVTGAIRVAVITNRVVKIVTTTAFKGVSDGGDVNPYPHAENYVLKECQEVINEPTDTAVLVVDNTAKVIDSLVDPILSNNKISNKKSRGVVESKDSEIEKLIEVNKPKWDSRAVRSMKRQIIMDNMPAIIREAPKKNKKIVKVTENAMSINELTQQLNEYDQNVTNITDECNFVDWSEHNEETYYFNYTTNQFVIMSNMISECEYELEEGYKAVTVGVPRSFTAALMDPMWGVPARNEYEIITTETGSIINCNQEVARENIKNGADCLRMIAIYEEKIRNGALVRKVRLVVDGSKQKNHGATYSPTPSREELLILLHVFAAKDWNYYFMDEKRAFLTAEPSDKRPCYVKFSGDSTFHQAVKSVYGKTDACRDYRNKTDSIMVNDLKCEQLMMCPCMYTKFYEADTIYDVNNKLINESAPVVVYDFVDDFIFGGSNDDVTLNQIKSFREKVQTDEPLLNHGSILGMEIVRIKEKRIILITMTKKIEELGSKHSNACLRKRNVPMPTTGYIVRQHEIDNMSLAQQRLLTTEEISVYLSIVGCLIWIQGVRLDIIFAVLYLSWFTKTPRQHHMDMALYIIGYLVNTKDMPLVLGGSPDIKVDVYIDASHATAPKSRSITGICAKLNPNSGAISAKSGAQTTNKLSSWESELDGTTTGFKTCARVSNILVELNIKTTKQPCLWNDNKAMIDFVKGDGVAKGVRHMELRMWYTKQEYQMGKSDLEYMMGTKLPADKLTKLGCVTSHRVYATDIQGLNLLGYDYFEGR